MSNYSSLIESFALVNNLSPTNIIDYEEVVVDDLAIGIKCDGNEETGDVLLYSTLGIPNKNKKYNIDRLLLEANNLGVGTGGCVLGRQENTGAVTIYTRLPIQLTHSQSLTNTLEAFYNMANLWKKEIIN